MFIQPVYNILLLPDVTYYFKKDFFADRADELKPGTQLLFALLKNEAEGSSLQAEDFYPIGLSARVESVSDEDVIQIRTIDRVEIISPVIENSEVLAAFAVRPSIEDLPKRISRKYFPMSVLLFSDLCRITSGEYGRGALSFNAGVFMI